MTVATICRIKECRSEVAGKTLCKTHLDEMYKITHDKMSDPVYEAKRNSLIPKAIQRACNKVNLFGIEKEKIDNGRGSTYSHSFFVEFYFEAMNDLARETGLTK